MTQTISKGNFGARLSPSTTGQSIGYRLENFDGSSYAAWTSTNVIELDVAGSWLLNADLAIPDAGVVAYWGVSGTDYLSESYGPDASSRATSSELSSLATSASINSLSSLLQSPAISIVNTASGSDITVYEKDTWNFTITLAGITLTDYEAIAFVAKANDSVSDDNALLYVRSDAAGLVRINGAAPSASTAGSLTVDSATQFTVKVDITETAVTIAKSGIWVLKVFDTTPAPDEGYTRYKGSFNVNSAVLQAVA